MIKEEFHGSDIGSVAKKYGLEESEIISFSSNVNPLGVSGYFKKEMAGQLDCIESYPERDYLSLRMALEGYTGVDHEFIIPGNGSTELISAFISSFDKCRALIVSPAYAEYERNLRLSGGKLHWFDLKEEDGFEFDLQGLLSSINKDTDIVIICNPVNPTSTALKASDMEKVAEKAAESNAFVLVDETYAEFCDMDIYSCQGLIDKYDNLFVIRSMSKFFSSPGLRLGYAMTSNKDLKEKILCRKEPWSVSSFAALAGQILLSDRGHIEISRDYIKKERERVCALLDEVAAYGLKYFRPCANFVLCELTDKGRSAGDLFDYCIRKKLMIRDCTGYGILDGRFFRFCFMDRESDDLLIDTLRSYLIGSD